MAAQIASCSRISGGVDSAVAAALLKRDGYEVHALFMRNWDEDEDGYCTAAADLQDARRVCDDSAIPLHTVSFAAEYRERVFAHFLDELAAGRTPNPDVACNREIKFGVCFEHARRLGADRFATGHYARSDAPRDACVCCAPSTGQGPDLLPAHRAVGALLARARSRSGDLPKREVRRLAREFALPVHDKRDSTGICFIGERPFARVPGDATCRHSRGRSRRRPANGSGRTAASCTTRSDSARGSSWAAYAAPPRRRGTSRRSTSTATVLVVVQEHDAPDAARR